MYTEEEKKEIMKGLLFLSRNAKKIAEESKGVESVLARGWQVKYEHRYLELKYGLVEYHTEILPKTKK